MENREQERYSTRIGALRAHSTIRLVACIGLALTVVALEVLQRQLHAHPAGESEWVEHNRYRAVEKGIWRTFDR